MVEDDRQTNTQATILAESGRLLATGDTPRVLLENGSREEIDSKTGRLDVLTFAEDTVDLASGRGPDSQRIREDSEMSMQELLHPNPAGGARGAISANCWWRPIVASPSHSPRWGLRPWPCISC